MISILFLLAGTLLLVLSILYGRLWSRGLDLEIRFEREHVHAGEQVLLSEVIQNQKRLPIPLLEIGFRIQKGIQFVDAPNVMTSDFCYKRDIFSLLGMEQITRLFVMDCMERGRYYPSQISLVSYSFMKTKRYIREQQSPEGELYVYPRRANLARVFPSLETVLGEASSSKALYEDPFSFSGIRPYVPTDPMKAINWKATARSGSLMVNTYTSTQSMEVLLYLDVQDPFVVPRTALVEEAISLASTLSERYLGAGMKVGFSCNARPENGSLGEPGFLGLPAGENTKPANGPGRQAAGRGLEADNSKEEGKGKDPLKDPAFFSLPLQAGREHLTQIQRFLTGRFPAERCIPFEQMLSSLAWERAGRVSPPGSVHVFLSMRAEDELARALEAFLPKGASALWIIPQERGGSLTRPRTWIPISQQEVTP